MWELRNVRPWGRDLVNIVIDGNTIVDLVPVGEQAREVDAEAESIDGGGRLALPGFINAHAHVDKSWWGGRWVGYGGESTTAGRIAHERAEREKLGIPSVAGARNVLREFLRHGTTASRTHVDVDLGVGLSGIEMVRQAQADLGGAIDLEIVAFPQDGVLRRPGVADLLRKAGEVGATSIGGLDPASIDRDPVGQLDLLFDIATAGGLGLDIHLHDPRELGAFQYELIIERTKALSMAGKVTISHGFALGQVPNPRQDQLLDALAEAGITWASVSPVGSAPLPWRGMRERGIGLGLGTDGIRDLWSPFGDGDMLKIALRFAQVHGLRTDADLAYAVHLATDLAAGYVHRDVHDLVPGARADIVVLDALGVQDALMRTPTRSVVISAGTLTTREGKLTDE